MREILFRRKQLDTGKWVEGYLLVIAKGTEYEQTYILGELDYREDICDVWKVAEEVDPNTIGQFTGLIDRNGKKIFEGDILDTPGWVVTYVADTNESYGMNAGWYYQRDDFES